ncbi:MAG: LysR family transcriptional regulator [Pseudomonadota bacterium]
MLNWNDYRYLLAVEMTGSLAAAARRLGVSQPTVGRRLTVLSDDLGVALVDMFSDGARLSEAGRRVCEQARVLEQQAALVELAAREAQGKDATRIRLAASEGLAHVVLVGMLAEFQAIYPHIHVDLISGTRLSDLRHSEADMAVRLGDPSDENLVGRAVGQIEYGLYAHGRYLDRGDPIRSPDDLNRHAIIESIGEIFNLPQARMLRSMAPRARVAFSSNSSLNQIDAMQAGFGILSLPNYRARGMDGVRRILPNAFGVVNDVWLLYRPSAKDQAGLRALTDFFSDRLPKRLRAVQAPGEGA